MHHSFRGDPRRDRHGIAPCDWTTPADNLWTKLFGHKVFHC
ncbi:MAG TPA: hypothetical protein VHJ76_06430 [Actinomycetota bacterium]|nr:hypothetical protein [Actinomycetota bacterium]